MATVNKLTLVVPCDQKLVTVVNGVTVEVTCSKLASASGEVPAPPGGDTGHAALRLDLDQMTRRISELEQAGVAPDEISAAIADGVDAPLSIELEGERDG